MTPRPLDGLTIVVTRPRAQSGKLASLLEENGARVVEFPTIEINPVPHELNLDALSRTGWAVFTSANAVHHLDPAAFGALKNARICAVGPATKNALAERGLTVDLLPPEYDAESAFAALMKFAGGRLQDEIFLPQGNIANPYLRHALEQQGAHVESPVVYETVIAAVTEDECGALVTAAPDILTFTSASTAKNFAELLGPQCLRKLRCAYASIGPQTTEAAKFAQLPITIEATQHDIPGLVRAITRWKQHPKK